MTRLAIIKVWTATDTAKAIAIRIPIAEEISFAIRGWAMKLSLDAFRPYPWNLCQKFPLTIASATTRVKPLTAIAKEIAIEIRTVSGI